MLCSRECQSLAQKNLFQNRRFNYFHDFKQNDLGDINFVIELAFEETWPLIYFAIVSHCISSYVIS